MFSPLGDPRTDLTLSTLEAHGYCVMEILDCILWLLGYCITVGLLVGIANVELPSQSIIYAELTRFIAII